MRCRLEFSLLIHIKWTLKTKLLSVCLINKYICSTLNKEAFASSLVFFCPAASCFMFSLNFKGTGWISSANSFYDRLIDGLIDWVMSLPVMKWWLMFCMSLRSLNSTPPTNSGPPSQRSPMLTTSCSGWVTEWWMSVERSPLRGRLEKGPTWGDNYIALVRATGMHCSDRGQPPANNRHRER